MNLGRFLGKWFNVLFHFPNISAFISIRGFIVTFVVLTLAAGLANLAFRLAQRFSRGFAATRSTRPRSRPACSSYRRLVQLLAAYDLEAQSGGDPERVRASGPTSF